MPCRWWMSVVLAGALALVGSVLLGCNMGRGGGNVFDVARELRQQGLSGEEALAHLSPGDAGTIGDITDMSGFEMIRLIGDGVVVGLQGTGDISGKSARKMRALALLRLLQMRDPYFRGNRKEFLTHQAANAWVRDGYVSLVTVETSITMGQHEGERVDVFVHAQDGASSLEGGYLFMTELSPYITTRGGETLTGHPLVEASGPVVIKTAGEGRAVSPRDGIVEGGGRLIDDYSTFVLPLRRPDARRAMFLQMYLNNRFSDLDPVAETTRPAYVAVRVPHAYWADPMRFVETVRFMPASYPGETRKRSLASQAARMLDSADPRERMEGAFRLEGLGSPYGVNALLSALAVGPALSRIEAARSLFFMGHEEGRDHARSLLGTGTAAERLEALKLYMLFDSRAPLDEMHRLLQQREPELAAAAAFAIDHCGGSAAEDSGVKSEVVDVHMSPGGAALFRSTAREEASYRLLAVPGASVEAVVAIVGDEERAIVFLGPCAIEGNFSVSRQRLAVSTATPGRIDVSFRTRGEEGRFQVQAEAQTVSALLEFMGLPWSDNMSVLNEISSQRALAAPVRTLSFMGSKTATRLMGALLYNR